jgi:PucR C-terminal helix-turn-helix domain/GGDEF-like domain
VGVSTRAEVARQLQRAVGDLTRTSLARMEREMPWFADLPPEHRSRIGSVLQAGYNLFIDWYCAPGGATPPVAGQVFGTAPRSFAGVITLQQTVAMIRLSIEVAEADLTEAVDPAHAAEVREAILVYGRELAFASADIYAHAAEMRGAWDARLEALVIDSVMRGDADETTRTRASALGWTDSGSVAVVVGKAPEPSAEDTTEALIDDVRRAARARHLDALGAIQGDRLVVVVSGVSDPDSTGALLRPHFGEGPVVVGPVVPDLLTAHVSAAEAVAGLRAAVSWPTTYVGGGGSLTSHDLLPERALDGDELARRHLVEEVFLPLQQAGGEVMATLTALLDNGGAIEGAARTLFVHPNTVRYRLRRVTELTGLSPQSAHQAFTLRVAIVLGRLSVARSAPPPAL